MSKFRAYSEFRKYPINEMIERSRLFLKNISTRRTVREFSTKKIPQKIIENCIKSAGSAPSGANLQPWTFVAINDSKTKKLIRQKAEEEEREFYFQRAPEEWLKALEPIGTDAVKEFLDTAPWIISIFVQKYRLEKSGLKTKNYYTNESVGIATGILINALHFCGLTTLTHTPSSMNFLNKILDRPKNEKPFLLLVVGFPKDHVKIPDIPKKTLLEIAKFV